MHFVAILKLCLHFLFCQRVSSSQNLFIQNEMFAKEDFNNIFEKFFVELNKEFLQKYKPRHIVLVGPTTNELQQVQPLFEHYPYIICQGTEKCILPQTLRRGSFTIVFLENLSKDMLRKNINLLSSCGKCKVLFIFNGIIQVEEIWLIFTMILRHHIPYFKFAHLGKNEIELYSESIATNCSMEVQLVNVWRPGIHLNNISFWNIRNNMNGCPVSLSSLTFTPKMFIEEDENGTLTVVGGREGKLLLALASKHNFTIKMRYPSVVDRMKYSRKVSIMYDVVSGISEIGIGRLRPISLNKISVSYPYDEECITWGVPRVIKWEENIVWVEFSRDVWALISLGFVVGCIVRYAGRNTDTSRNNEHKSIGFITIVFDALGLHLGVPIVHGSFSVGSRFLLIVYLYYATVIITAYKTSLASILATDRGTPTIINAQGIIDSNLNVTGSLYDYNILNDQLSDSEVNAKLLDRFFIDNSDLTLWEKLTVPDQEWAVLGRRTYLNYYRQELLKDNEFPTFDVLNDCVLGHSTVMLFQARSVLHKPVDNTIRHLVESGILQHWDVAQLDSEKLLKNRRNAYYFEQRATEKFWRIFIYYSICIVVCLITFLIELLTLIVSFDPRKR